MKKLFFLIIALSISMSSFAADKAKNDTIGIDQREVTRWIKEPYINSKGKESVHYYAIWRGSLLTTSKTTIEKVNLCAKYGARCALIVIGQRQSDGSFKPKRITTN